MTLYLSLKFKKFILITNNYFSIGDVLFLIAVSPFFNNLKYVFFINVGTLLTLLIYFLFQKKQHQKNIPFAGNMALVLIFLIILFNE
jgi:ABC-type phosphate transport system permease subunit